jgi:phosphatidylglycerophosphate synthase
MADQPTVFVARGADPTVASLRVGGLGVLERSLLRLSREGVKAVNSPGPPLEQPTSPFGPLTITWLPADAAPPEGARVEHADQIAEHTVTDAASAERAEWALILGLSKAHQGPIDALINWRFSMRITRRLCTTAITPNHITFAGILVGLLASATLLGRTWLALAAGGVLLQLHSILDSCDGELARLRYQFSKYGQWFDNLADDFVDNVFIVCAGLAAGGPFAILGALGAGGRLFTNLVAYQDVYRRTGTGDLYAFRLWFERGKQKVTEVYDPKSWFTWVRAVGRRDTYVFGWLLLLLGGLPEGVAVWGAILGTASAVTILLHLGITLTLRGKDVSKVEHLR